MCKNNLFYYIYLLCFFTTVFIFFSPGCESLPSQSEDPDNPLDPNNPNNTFNGPALVLSPTKVDVKNNGQFYLELWIVESDSIAAMSTRILYDPSKLRAESVDSLQTNSESFFLQNGGQLIWLSTINNDSGFIQIDCAVVEGDPRDVEGDGKILRIFFSHLSESTASIRLSTDSYLRNSQNEAVIINDLLDSDIIIK
jgi:hypothetical protein